MELNISYSDRKVSQRRIKEIDELRAAGGKTELEVWWKSVDTRKKKEAKEVKESYKNRSGYRIFVGVIDEMTGEEKHYASLKQVCDEYNLPYGSIKSKLNRSGREISVKDLTITKLKDLEVKEELLQKETRSLGNKNWSEKDAAILVRKRVDEKMSWPELAKYFRKSKNCCVGKFNRIEKEGLIDYYLNLKIEEVGEN